MSSFTVVADIGGTNARFACSSADTVCLSHIRNLHCADFAHIADAIRHYLDSPDVNGRPQSICLAVAGPVETDYIDLPNNHWAFSKQQLQQTLGTELKVINDFTAQLLSVPTLRNDELVWLGEAKPLPDQVMAVLGPGTGLGAAGMTPGGEIIPSEGGHLAFAPVNAHELEILRLLWNRYPRVSVERLLSGPGLAALHHANSVLAGQEQQLRAEQVTAAAGKGDALALQSIENFAAILGSVAGELAIALGARGGVYLTGGMLQYIDGLYPQQVIRERFNDKGRFTEYCSTISLALMKAEHTGLRGCARALLDGFT